MEAKADRFTDRGFSEYEAAQEFQQTSVEAGVHAIPKDLLWCRWPLDGGSGSAQQGLLAAD